MTMQARNKPKPGALQKQLDAQKRMNDRDALKQASERAIQEREADAKRQDLMHD